MAKLRIIIIVLFVIGINLWGCYSVPTTRVLSCNKSKTCNLVEEYKFGKKREISLMSPVFIKDVVVDRVSYKRYSSSSHRSTTRYKYCIYFVGKDEAKEEIGCFPKFVDAEDKAYTIKYMLLNSNENNIEVKIK